MDSYVSDEVRLRCGVFLCGRGQTFRRADCRQIKATERQRFLRPGEDVGDVGKNLDEYLSDVYLRQARFCVMFVSREYAEKMWTRLERRSAMARAIQQKGEYILPIRLDHTELEGFLPTIHYISSADHDAESIVQLIVEKLDDELTAGRRAPTPPRPSAFNIPLPEGKENFQPAREGCVRTHDLRNNSAVFRGRLKAFKGERRGHRGRFRSRAPLKVPLPHIRQRRTRECLQDLARRMESFWQRRSYQLL